MSIEIGLQSIVEKENKGKFVSGKCGNLRETNLNCHLKLIKLLCEELEFRPIT